MSFGMCGQRPAPGSARTQRGVVRPTAGTLPRVTTAEIREGFLRYFEREGHLRIPSASLVPFEDDPSVLLTIAGMQPLKSYFLSVCRSRLLCA
jgi:tRNA synthetases class II (A)